MNWMGGSELGIVQKLYKLGYDDDVECKKVRWQKIIWESKKLEKYNNGWLNLKEKERRS